MKALLRMVFGDNFDRFLCIKYLEGKYTISWLSFSRIK